MEPVENIAELFVEIFVEIFYVFEKVLTARPLAQRQVKNQILFNKFC
jgi:hypothetical protein